VRALSAPENAILESIYVVEPDELFSDFEKDGIIPIAEAHPDCVGKSLDRSDLILLVDSRSCEVETVRHKKEPFYGVQFQPRRFALRAKNTLKDISLLGIFMIEL